MRLTGYSLGRLLPLFCASVAVAASTRAAGAGTHTLWLSLPSCSTPPYREAELQHALDVELGPRGLHVQLEEGGEAASGPRVLLSLSGCDPEAESVLVQISTARAPAPVDRSIDLRAIDPTARARTLAVLIADALEPPHLPGGSEPAADSAAKPPHGAAAAAELAPLPFRFAPAGLSLRDDLLLQREDPYPWPGGLHLGAAAHAHLITRHSNALYGFELNAGGHFLGRTAWVVEGSYSRGNTFAAERDYRLQWLHAAVGLDFGAGQRPHLAFGPRLGVARVIGDSEDGFGDAIQDRAMLVTLGARIGMSVPVGRYTSLELSAEASDHLYERFFTEDGDLLPLYGMILSWGVGVSFAL
jgi:hypothetical protein